MNMHELTRIAVVAAVAFVFAATPASAQKVLKLSLWITLDSVQGQGAQLFKKIVAEKSGGSLDVRLFPSNQLGAPADVVDAMTKGAIEMSLYSFDQYQGVSPIVAMAGLNFIFATREHAFKFYESQSHQAAKEEILKKIGVRVIGNAEWNQGPYKVLLTRDPVTKVDDMKGVPMRVPDTEMPLLVWGDKGVGTRTTAVPWPEAPLALRQGLVRAIEVPADFVRPMKFYESAKYLTLTRHMHQVSYMAISEKVWQTLTDKEKQALEEANRVAGLSYTEAVQKQWMDDIAFLKRQGVVVVDFDMAPWHERALSIARELEARGRWEKGLVDKLSALK